MQRRQCPVQADGVSDIHNVRMWVMAQERRRERVRASGHAAVAEIRAPNPACVIRFVLAVACQNFGVLFFRNMQRVVEPHEDFGTFTAHAFLESFADRRQAQ
jgi:hypothetical protein